VKDRLVAEGFELEKMSPPEVTAVVRRGSTVGGHWQAADGGGRGQVTASTVFFKQLCKPEKRRI